MAEARKLTLSEICEELDISQATVTRYITLGMPHSKGKTKAEGNRFDAGECAAWMLANNLTGKVGKPSSEISEEQKAETLRKTKAQADKYEQELLTARLEYQQRLGELVPRAEVDKGRLDRITFVKSGLMAMASALSSKLEGMPAVEIQKEIEGYVKRLLEQFSKE